jgi:Mg-chelatase subunit ChlD
MAFRTKTRQSPSRLRLGTERQGFSLFWGFAFLCLLGTSGCHFMHFSSKDYPEPLMDPDLLRADQISVKNIGAAVPVKHPVVLQQKVAIKNPELTKKDMRKLMREFKLMMAKKYPQRTKPISIGIASLLDESTTLRPTEFSNWTLSNLNYQAGKVGMIPLPVDKDDQGKAANQLSSVLSPLDLLYAKPNLLWKFSVWPTVNINLKKTHDTEIDAMLISKLRLAKSRDAIELDYRFIDLRDQDPETGRIFVAMNGIRKVPLSGRISNDLDVYMVLDASGSMQTNDQTGVRIAAAKKVLERLKNNLCANESVRVGTLIFNHVLDDRVSTIGLFNIKEEHNYERVKGSIESAGADGGTNLDVAFDSINAYVENERLDRRLHVIHFTDGQHSAHDPLERRWRDLNRYTQQTISTVSGSVVGLGQEPDQGILEDIARSLGGKVRVKRVSVDHLASRLFKAFYTREIDCATPVSSQTISVDPKDPSRNGKARGSLGPAKKTRIRVIRQRFLRDRENGQGVQP